MDTPFVPSLAKSYDKLIRPFIDLIDRLRKLGVDEDVALPTIIALGDQSSGKSSILEAISGVQLPRGSGLVTRCPLDMQLKRLPRSSESSWTAEISHIECEKPVIINSPDEIGKEIERAQDLLTGGDKSHISEELITLKISSPDVPDLSLIDLPGLVRCATKDQPADVHEQIRRIVLKYAAREETVILCVIPLNQDSATIEAYQIAQDVDPEGCRTLGVLTKPDLVEDEKEKEALAVARNQGTKTLVKGYTTVKCRTQKDINNKMTLDDAIREEENFFKSHKYFNALNKNQRGIHSLADKLSDELILHIKKCLPNLKERISKNMNDAQQKIRSLPAALPEKEADKRLFFMKLVMEFNHKLESVLTVGSLFPRSIFTFKTSGGLETNIFSFSSKNDKSSCSSFGSNTSHTFGKIGIFTPSFSFAQAQTNAAGTNVFNNTFGSGTIGVFGQTPTNVPGTSLFGNAASQPTQGTDIYKQKPAASTFNFGAASTAALGTNIFGGADTGALSTLTTSGSLFRASPTTAGTAATNTGSSPFNSGLFGVPSNPATSGSLNNTGTVVKFNPPMSTDTVPGTGGLNQVINTKHQCISAMIEYEQKSLEELRIEDFMANRKEPQAHEATGIFGAPALLSSTATGAFGTFGAFGSNIAASVQKPSFGASKPATGEINLHKVFDENVHSFYILRNIEKQLKEKIELITTSAFQVKGEFAVNVLVYQMDIQRGRELPYFQNYQIFENCARSHVLKYKEYIQQCKSDISDITDKILRHIAKTIFDQLPVLLSRVLEEANIVREDCLADAESQLTFIFDRESLVYSQDDTFIEQCKICENMIELNAPTVAPSGNLFAAAPFPPKKASNNDNSGQKNAETLQDLLRNYFEVANKRICDEVPSTLRICLQRCFFKKLQEKLLSITLEESASSTFIKEDKNVERQRQEIQKVFDRLHEANCLISKFIN